MPGWDFLVFDPAAWLKSGWGFWDWVEALQEWLEDHHFDDPSVSTPSIASWFERMEALYPETTTFDGDVLAERGGRYVIGETAVHVRFVGVDQPEAIGAATAWARKFELGYVRLDGAPSSVMTPAGDGNFRPLLDIYPDPGL